MIVKCEQCQTRFKVPDEKVTDKGVKVRCTKCGNTFRVTKDGNPVGDGAAAGGSGPVAPSVAPVSGKTKPAMSVQLGEAEADPFAAFGYSQGVPDPEATRPGVFSLGLEASRVPDMGAPPVPPQAPAVGGSFDFSSLAPPMPPPVPRRSVPPPPPRPSAPTAQTAPFDFSALAPSPAVAAAAPAPFDFAALGPPSPQSSAAPAAAAATPSFDFSSLGSMPPAPPPPPPPSRPTMAPPAPVAATPAFDFSGLGGSSAAPPPQPSAPRPPAAAVPPPPPSSAPRPAAVTATAPKASAPPLRNQSSAPMSFEGEDTDAAAQAQTETSPALFGGHASSADDFFGGALTQQDKPVLAPSEVSGDSARTALFDMAAALPDAPPDEQEPAPALEIEAVAPPPKPAPVRSTPTPVPEAPRRHRSVLGVVVNVAIAALLVFAAVVVGSAYLNEGKVTAETLSWQHLKSTFAPASDFVAGDISNGLYDTRGGKPLFFVRGEVTNRGASAVQLLVRAELLEGSTLVRAAESAAGMPASPEELFLVVTTEDLQALDERVTGRAPVVEPGATAPFLVAFFEYPPDLKTFRVRVSARPLASPSTAHREQ